MSGGGSRVTLQSRNFLDNEFRADREVRRVLRRIERMNRGMSSKPKEPLENSRSPNSLAWRFEFTLLPAPRRFASSSLYGSSSSSAI